MYTIKEGYRGRFVAALLNETAEFRKKGMRHSTMERLVQKTDKTLPERTVRLEYGFFRKVGDEE